MVDAIYRSGSRAILATLIRLLGDFDIAELAHNIDLKDQMLPPGISRN